MQYFTTTRSVLYDVVVAFVALKKEEDRRRTEQCCYPPWEGTGTYL